MFRIEKGTSILFKNLNFSGTSDITCPIWFTSADITQEHQKVKKDIRKLMNMKANILKDRF